MADKKGDNVSEERLFTIPLRKEWLKVPLNKRAKRSIRTIKVHLSRHMKVPDKSIRISAELNKTVWIRGAGKPPSKVRIKARFDATDGILHAMLPDEKPPAKEKEKKESKPPAGQETGEKEAKPQKSGRAEEKGTEKEAKPESIVKEKETLKEKQEPEKVETRRGGEESQKDLPEKDIQKEKKQPVKV